MVLSRFGSGLFRAIIALKEIGNAIRYTDEFRRDTVRIATTSELARPMAASDLGVGLSTLNK